ANNCGSARRCNACWNVDRLPIRGMNCLGMPSREAGHSRVPEPPARSTGRMRDSAMALCYADLRRQEGNPDCLAGLRTGVDFEAVMTRSLRAMGLPVRARLGSAPKP